MSESKPLYEGLFMFDPAKIASNVGTATETVRNFLNRAEAEILSIFKWDDRKLAYDIKAQKRGLYMLAYFRADGSKITGLERDVNLSEHVTRCMILRADHIGETELADAAEKQTATQAEAALQAEREPETTDAAPESDTASEAETTETAATE